MESMMSMYNIARDKQKVKQNEFDPYASATGAMMQGVSGGLEKREAQPGKNVDMFLKLLDIAKKQGEIQAQQRIAQQNQEMHQQIFGNLNANNEKNTTDKMGKPIHTAGSRIGKLWETHDIYPKYDSKTGSYDVDMKPKKEPKRTMSEEVSLHRQKKTVEYDLKKKYGSVDPNAIALEINRLADPYRDFGKEVNWTKMQTENPKLFKTIQMLYDMHRKLRTKQFNPDDPLGISDTDLEE